LGALQLVLAGLGGEWPAQFLRSIALSTVAGAVVGVVVTALRVILGRKRAKAEAFTSSLLSKELISPLPVSVVVGRILIGALIGIAAGALAGAAGSVSLPQFLDGSADAVVALPSVAIHVLAGGGFGGPGTDGFFSLAFFFLVILVLVLLSGLAAGFLMTVALWAVGGASKGAAKDFVIKVLGDGGPGVSSKDEKPIIAGLVRGALIGIIVGLLQAGFTTWAVAHLQK